MTRNDEPREPQMPRRLPVVEIDGKLYFQDDRLKEYRATDNPHERITFREYDERFE
jgi:hypothetical protein